MPAVFKSWPKDEPTFTSQIAVEVNGRGQIDPPAISLVAIAGSAGGIEAIRDILGCLPANFPAPVVYLQHLSASEPSGLVKVLQYYSTLKIQWAQQGDHPEPGVVYVCPAGYSIVIQGDGTLALSRPITRRESFHTADLFFTSVAASHGPRAVIIVLSGVGQDGAEGVCAVNAQRGRVLVQDEESAFVWGMPKAALATGCVDAMLAPLEIAPLLVSLGRDGSPFAGFQSGGLRFVERKPLLTATLQNCLAKVLAMAVSSHGTDLGNIQLLNPETDALSIVAQRGFGLDFLDYFEAVSAQDGAACSRAMSNREPVFIPDVSADPLFAPHRKIAAAAGFRAVQSTPLISRHGSLLGILSTHFRSPQPKLQIKLRAIQQHAYRATEMIDQLSLVGA